MTKLDLKVSHANSYYEPRFWSIRVRLRPRRGSTWSVDHFHVFTNHKALCPLTLMSTRTVLSLWYKQRVLIHGHQGWNVRHGLCHIYMRYVHIWVVYSLCFFCCLFITVTWWYVWCIEWASGNQEEVQACLVTLWLFIISCYSLYKTTLGLLCSWFENNPHFHKYSIDFHV